MKIESAKVTFELDDPNEIIEAMDSEEKVNFIQSLSCHDEIIQCVLEQVFEGSTDNGSYGYTSCHWKGSAPLDMFKKKMVDFGADYATKERIEKLESSLKSLEERNESLALQLDKIENPHFYSELSK